MVPSSEVACGMVVPGCVVMKSSTSPGKPTIWMSSPSPRTLSSGASGSGAGSTSWALNSPTSGEVSGEPV